MVEFFGAVILGILWGFVILFVLAGILLVAFAVCMLVGYLVALATYALGSKESS